MDWSNVAQAKNVDSWVAFYSDDAIVLPPNDKIATGKEAIRTVITNLLAAPGLSIKWQPSKVEVARSGDLGYSQGTFEMTVSDPKGNPIMDRGKYVEIWKKQADGSWKLVADSNPAGPTG